MCLGDLGRVCAVTGTGELTVDVAGRERRVSGALLDVQPSAGDWVVIHAGFALARLDADQARDALALRASTGWIR